MQFFPTLDIKDGECVRLFKGGLDSCKVHASSALAADWLHAVDLDGSLAGKPRNMHVIAKIIKAANCRVQIGGGYAT